MLLKNIEQNPIIMIDLIEKVKSKIKSVNEVRKMSLWPSKVTFL